MRTSSHCVQQASLSYLYVISLAELEAVKHYEASTRRIALKRLRATTQSASLALSLDLAEAATSSYVVTGKRF